MGQTFLFGGLILGGDIDMQATKLWTNPSPTASFGGKQITLSDSIQNFDYVAVTCKQTTATDAKMSTAIYSIKDINSMITNSIGSTYYIVIGNNGGSSYVSFRSLTGTKGTQLTNTLTFSQAFYMSASGADNTTVVPLYVYGLKGSIDGI